jgi:hypothetical protein
MHETDALSYKENDMFVRHSLLALSECPRDDAPNPPPDDSDSLLDQIAEVANSSIDCPEVIFTQLLDLLQQFRGSNPPDPIDDFLSDTDLWRPIGDGLTAPLTPVIHFALKSLMVFCRVCPDIVCAFVIGRDVLLCACCKRPILFFPR